MPRGMDGLAGAAAYLKAYNPRMHMPHQYSPHAHRMISPRAMRHVAVDSPRGVAVGMRQIEPQPPTNVVGGYRV